mmetsp:Transcript_19041/g.41394  ORF Transcript_19041/g.41394 Transcript_19041/m.41394 type:complete len:256 (+) Transcript_19041:54-821(+)
MEPRIHRRKQTALSPNALQVSLLINFILIFALFYFSFANNHESGSSSRENEVTETMTVWHGGHPAEDRSGSCWCGTEDKYCMCTPNLAIDLIITSSKETTHGSTDKDYVWLVRRKDTNQLATMGGFVDVNEAIEDAIIRELMEEMALTLREPPTLVGIYSDPRRDNRRRTASVVFAVHVTADIQPHAGDDVKEVVKIPIDEIENQEYFADHRTILLDYRSTLREEVVEDHSTEGDFAANIKRSTCGTSSSPQKHR